MQSCTHSRPSVSFLQVRQQLYINASGEKFSPSFMATLVRMVQTEGPLSIFKGLSVRDRRRLLLVCGFS